MTPFLAFQIWLAVIWRAMWPNKINRRTEDE
jgi:hypothetical protein